MRLKTEAEIEVGSVLKEYVPHGGWPCQKPPGRRNRGHGSTLSSSL